MSINIIAILISLAMMLTGAGGEGQPAEASRMLSIYNVSVTYNDETVTLEPALWLGVSSNGEKAVFDLGVQMDGDTLFPTQLGVDESGITALFKNSDVAAKISAKAFDSLNEQINQAMGAVQSQMAEGENAELIAFITEEYLPAYAGMLEAVQDPEYVKALKARGNAVFAEVIDRGEGTPVTESVNGQDYALNAYTYTIESDKLAELCDALYASDDVLKGYYDAMFKMYGMLPEESGLNGITSFQEMFAKTGMNVTMDVNEKLSDDGEVDIVDAVMTMDMNGMIKTMAAAAEEAEEDAEDGASSDLPAEIPPVVLNIHSAEVAGVQDANATCNYEIPGEEAGMNMAVSAHSDGEDDMNMTMDMEITEDGERIGTFHLSAFTGSAGGGKTYDINCHIDVDEPDDAEFGFHAHGIEFPTGDANNSFEFETSSDEQYIRLSFDADVMTGTLSDEANGHEAVLTLDDFSQETLNGLGEDQAFQAAMMQVAGSMSADSQKLMANESVQKMIALFGSMNAQPAVIEDSEDVAEIDEGEIENYGGYEEPVDDGELGYEVPEFTWLPEGWKLQNTDMDTQYDWVSLSFANDDYSESLYATFYKNEENNAINYVVGGDGEIEAVDGREMTVTDFGGGSVAVNLHEDHLDGSLSFFCDGLDVETIGKIVAGIQY